jgi:hypothetical protein
MSARHDCNICAEENAGKITCTNCSFNMCRPCLKRYTLERPDAIPSCPSCNVQWTYEQQVSHLSATFVKGTLRKRKRDIALSQENVRLAASGPSAQKVYYSRQEKQLKIHLTRTIASLQTNPSDTGLHLIQMLRHKIEQIQRRMHAVGNTTVRCAHSNCGRFVDINTGACITCSKETCIRCSQPIVEGEQHVCDANTLANIQTMNNECRPCAGCHAMTIRSEGCPVMWCAHCHAFWNWDTGELIRGRAPHNPDHRNWLTRGGTAPRELGDVPCGGVPTYEAIHNALTSVLWADTYVTNDQIIVANAFLTVRNCVENSHAIVRPLFPVVSNQEMLCHDLRIAFLLGDISKSKFEAKVTQRLSKSYFQAAVGPILEMFTFSGIDILLKASYIESTSQIFELYFELLALREIVNSELARVSSEFGRKVPVLTEFWQWKLPHRVRVL